MKIPPDYGKPKISCPRCGRENEVPLAELAAMTAAVGAVTAEEGEKKEALLGVKTRQTYVRKGKGWESFTCSCGRLLQISPAFGGSHIVCSTCGGITEIKN